MVMSTRNGEATWCNQAPIHSDLLVNVVFREIF